MGIQRDERNFLCCVIVTVVHLLLHRTQRAKLITFHRADSCLGSSGLTRLPPLLSFSGTANSLSFVSQCFQLMEFAVLLMVFDEVLLMEVAPAWAHCWLRLTMTRITADHDFFDIITDLKCWYSCVHPSTASTGGLGRNNITLQRKRSGVSHLTIASRIHRVCLVTRSSTTTDTQWFKNCTQQ